MTTRSRFGRISRGFGPYLFSQRTIRESKPYDKVLGARFREVTLANEEARNRCNDALALYIQTYPFRDKIFSKTQSAKTAITQLGLFKFLWLSFVKHFILIGNLTWIYIVYQLL